MTPHLLRCQGFTVVYYGFTLGRLGSGVSSTFAQLRYKVQTAPERFWAVHRGLNRPLEDERNIERRQSKHILLVFA
jgi:hypothetical protein